MSPLTDGLIETSIIMIWFIRKATRFLQLFSFLLLLDSCEERYEEASQIFFYNRSDRDVMVVMAFDYPEDSTGLITDTALLEWKTGKPVLKGEQFVFKQHHRHRNIWGSWRGEYMFSHFFSFTIIDKKIVETPETIESIYYDYNVLARYDVTEEDMDNLEWSLEYPPTEAMRNVHMYPSFDEIVANAGM